MLDLETAGIGNYKFPEISGKIRTNFRKFPNLQP